MEKDLFTSAGTTESRAGESAINEIRYPDGTVITELRLLGADSPVLIVRDADGLELPPPGAGRYPFTERLNRIANEVIEHHS